MQADLEWMWFRRMLALIASAMLGLYVFLPIALFDKLAAPFVRLKKNQRTRTEEVVAGMLVAAVPFGLTLLFSRYFWHVGHWPFSLSDAEAVRKMGDYKTVFSSLYSDRYFDANSTQFWISLRRIFFHQSRFVTWNYTFLLLEVAIVSGVTLSYGDLNKSAFLERRSVVYSSAEFQNGHLFSRHFSSIPRRTVGSKLTAAFTWLPNSKRPKRRVRSNYVSLKSGVLTDSPETLNNALALKLTQRVENILQAHIPPERLAIQQIPNLAKLSLSPPLAPMTTRFT